MPLLNTGYTMIGSYTVVPVADLSLLASAINTIAGDNRKGGNSCGKAPGQVVLADMTGGVYREVVCISTPDAIKAAAADKWQTVDGSTQYTPI